jgi:Glyoxalase-like domain
MARTPMSWHIDHVFFATSDADSAEGALSELGLMFTERRVHPGQGTANACANFDNAFLEILGPANVDQLTSAIVQPLGLDDRIRWRDTGACPFGLCFRSSHARSKSEPWPFETWPYEAPYLPTGGSIPIVTPAGCLGDPLLFITTRAQPEPGGTRRTQQRHGVRRALTRVKVYRPGLAGVVSSGVRWFAEHGHFSLAEGPVHALELEWDHGREGTIHRFPASLPIVLCW